MFLSQRDVKYAKIFYDMHAHKWDILIKAASQKKTRTILFINKQILGDYSLWVSHEKNKKKGDSAMGATSQIIDNVFS